jgi:carbamoyl-phosphate synthase large subunit
VLLDRFLDHAVEVDVDVIADAEGNVLIGGIMEHIEEAGVHSGDSSCSLPPYSLSAATRTSCAARPRMAQAAEVVGLMNTQFAIQARGRARRLRAGGEPARLAHRALRLQGHRHAAGQDRGALHGRQDAAAQGATREVVPRTTR